MHNAVEIILEFANSIWSRRWYAMAVTWVVCLIGWAAVAMMPDQYKVLARVFVDTTSVLRPLLAGIVIEPNVEDDLRLMRQTLLNRSNVEKVMRMTDLDLGVRTKIDKEQLIASLQKRTSIGSSRTEGNIFSISFTDIDPVRARDVVQAFTTVFVENNVGENRDDTEVAREFLEEQTAFYRQQLEESEQKLADFQREYADILPESAGSVGSRFLSTQNELKEAIAQRDELKRQLSSIDPYNQADESAGYGQGPPSFDQLQIAELEGAIEALLAQYTEKHPEVIIARRRLAALLGRLEATKADFEASLNQNGEALSPNISRQANPVYQALKIELVKSESNISVLKQRLEDAEIKWQGVRSRIDQAPLLTVQQLKLQRDYGIVKSKYNQLLDRQEAMKISTDRSIKSDDVKFRIIDPPIVPIKPEGPNRALFLNAVLLLALASGLGSAAMLALMRKTFQNIRTLRSSFSIPVYGAIRDVNTRFRRRKLFLDFLGVSLSGGSLISVLLVLLVLESRVGLPNVAAVENAPQSLEMIKQIIDDGIQILDGRI